MFILCRDTFGDLERGLRTIGEQAMMDRITGGSGQEEVPQPQKQETVVRVRIQDFNFRVRHTFNARAFTFKVTHCTN